MNLFQLEKFSLSYLAVGLFFPISFFAYLLARSNSDASLKAILIQGLFVTLCTEFLLFIYTRWQISYLRSSSEVGAVAYLAPIICVGIFRGVTVSLTLNFFGDGVDEALYARMPVSIISTLLWLGLVTYFVNESQSYSREFNSLFSRAVYESLRRDGKGVHFRLYEYPEILGFKRELSNLINFKDIDSNEIDQIFGAAAAIKRHLQFQLRPLSHRLWVSPDFQMPRFRISRLLLDAIQYLHFSVWKVLLPWITIFFFGSLPFLPIRQSLLFSFVFFIALIFPLLLARVLVRLKVNGFLTLSIMTALFLSTPVPLSNALLHYFSSAKTFSNLILIHSLTAITGICFVLFNSTVRLMSADRSTLIESIPLAAQSLQERKYVASYLHNSMLSQLTSIAMQLESADGKSVTQDVHTALKRLGSLINQEMADHFSETTQTITGQLVELADLWLGLADIRFQGFTDEELAPHEVPVLVLFLEEVIANSVRHGGATEIEFRMVVDSRHLELSAIHNGQNAIVEGSGLGVAWLNEYAQRRWEITSHAGRTTLVALINRVI